MFSYASWGGEAKTIVEGFGTVATSTVLNFYYLEISLPFLIIGDITLFFLLFGDEFPFMKSENFEIDPIYYNPF